MQELTLQIETKDNEMKVYNKRLTEETSLYNGLMSKLDNGRKYFAKKKTCKLHRQELIKIQETIKEAKRKQEKLRRLLLTLDEMLKELEEQLILAKDPLYVLRGNAYYKEVAAEQPKYSSKSLELLVSERKSLGSKLENKQKGREILEEKLNTVESKLKDLTNELKLLEQQYGTVEAIEFPAHGNEEILKLSMTIRNVDAKIDSLRPTVDGLREQWKKASNEFDFRKEDFYKVYRDIVIFHVSFEEVKDQLNIEKKSLQERDKFLVSEQKRYQFLEAEINKAIIELEKQDMLFAFRHENVREQLLDEQIKQNYAYKRMEHIFQLIKIITSVQEKVTSLRKKRKEEKIQFINFCDNNIFDIKLRNTCIKGIEHKITYDDVIEWQEKMSDRIQRTVKIAEEDMREHDKQLQQFIAHLHLYLRTIADELRLIPRQTRVKVEDKTKDIFIFSVPDWNEQEGKEALRNHIDWMVIQLDKDEYKDDEGKENESLIRKQIEKWLNTKQLLKNVLKEKEISVKCRKVSNDGKVSGALTSWDRTNAWSGGEKWSKNMTLFLGILNYIAEKRVPLQGNQKTHRTVIVDNPFGKASSDHVLEPVFFIAEQLGFQIIALTAHAEGKFIRKYFPVVYSCRLRESASGETQIMTKNKEVRTAFFRDNDPEAMVRLGEQEQLTLF